MSTEKDNANTIHTVKQLCPECSEENEFVLTAAANYIFVCPLCKELCGIDCEYGYANIVPCDILMGSEKIGEITEYRTEHKAKYRLVSERFHIKQKLSGGYADLEAYKEALTVLEPFLKRK